MLFYGRLLGMLMTRELKRRRVLSENLSWIECEFLKPHAILLTFFTLMWKDNFPEEVLGI